MKRLIPVILFLMFIAASAFCATDEQIDSYWREYCTMTYKINVELSKVQSSSDFEATKTRIHAIMQENGTKMAAMGITREDSNQIGRRYMFHLKSGTSLGVSLKAVNGKFYQEYARIKRLNGGEAFITGIFPMPTQNSAGR